VGAFLSLLNNVVILKKYLPAKRFGRCEFGLTAKDRMDCIYCDRCRYEAKAVLSVWARPVKALVSAERAVAGKAFVGAWPSRDRKEEVLPAGEYVPGSLLSRYFVVSVLAVAIFVSAISVNTFLKTVPVGLESAALVSSAGQPRDVDLQRVRSMIEQKQLSDREAEFYKKVE
jgi:hypothetical protein